MRASPIAICLLASVLPNAAFAAEGDSPAAAPDSGDIVVTARRTAERLQDVPVAVTALSGAMLERRNLTTVAEIQAFTPSLNFTTTNGQGAKSAVALRGQRQSGSGIGVDPSVGVYINELYMGRATIDTALYDLESVQILKGPQGTLFGRNTTGGAVLLSTKKPGDEFGGYAKAQFETPWGYTLEGALNAPLGENAALRIAGVRQYNDGYSQVVNRGTRIDGRDRVGVRGSLKFGGGPLNTLFVGDYYRWHDSGIAFYPIRRINPPGGNAVYNAYDAALAVQAAGNYLSQRKITNSGPTFSRGRTYSALNATTYQLTDTILVKNIIGIAASFDENAIDYDGTSANVLSTGVSADQHQFSEELQLQGKSLGGSLDWIAGVYFFHEWGYDHGGAFAGTDPTLPHTGTRNLFSADNKAISGFVHGSYLLPISVPAHLYGGLRRGEDTRRISFETVRDVAGQATPTCLVAGAPATLGVIGGACQLTARKKYPSTTWDIGIDVKPVSGLLLYATVARGYRTGGFNGRAQAVAQQIPFNPEKVLNYEVGLKFSGDLGTMPTTLNVAAYHSAYSDIQQNIIFVPPGGGISSSVINAAKGRVNGIEIEASIRPVESVTLSGFYSLTDAKYSQFTQAVAAGGTQDLSGNSFAGVPRNAGGVSLDWEVLDTPGFGKLRASGNVRFNGAYELDPIFMGARIKAYTLANASITLEKAFGSPASIELYVKNIGDRIYGTGGFSSFASGFAAQSLGAPRIFGIGLKVPFGGG